MGTPNRHIEGVMLSQALSSADSPLLRADSRPVEWVVSPGYADYAGAEAAMEARVAAIHAGEAPERVWLLEHPPLYTAGTSADPAELIDPRFPVHDAGRGGRYTYHGPGQRIGYLNIDLSARGKDVRNFVHHLEGWMIAALGGRANRNYRVLIENFAVYP